MNACNFLRNHTTGQLEWLKFTKKCFHLYYATDPRVMRQNFFIKVTGLSSFFFLKHLSVGFCSFFPSSFFFCLLNSLQFFFFFLFFFSIPVLIYTFSSFLSSYPYIITTIILRFFCFVLVLHLAHISTPPPPPPSYSSCPFPALLTLGHLHISVIKKGISLKLAIPKGAKIMQWPVCHFLCHMRQTTFIFSQF